MNENVEKVIERIIQTMGVCDLSKTMIQNIKTICEKTDNYEVTDNSFKGISHTNVNIPIVTEIIFTDDSVECVKKGPNKRFLDKYKKINDNQYMIASACKIEDCICEENTKEIKNIETVRINLYENNKIKSSIDKKNETTKNYQNKELINEENHFSKIEKYKLSTGDEVKIINEDDKETATLSYTNEKEPNEIKQKDINISFARNLIGKDANQLYGIDEIFDLKTR